MDSSKGKTQLKSGVVDDVSRSRKGAFNVTLRDTSEKFFIRASKGFDIAPGDRVTFAASFPEEGMGFSYACHNHSKRISGAYEGISLTRPRVIAVLGAALTAFTAIWGNHSAVGYGLGGLILGFGSFGMVVSVKANAMMNNQLQMVKDSLSADHEETS